MSRQFESRLKKIEQQKAEAGGITAIYWHLMEPRPNGPVCVGVAVQTTMGIAKYDRADEESVDDMVGPINGDVVCVLPSNGR